MKRFAVDLSHKVFRPDSDCHTNPFQFDGKISHANGLMLVIADFESWHRVCGFFGISTKSTVALRRKTLTKAQAKETLCKQSPVSSIHSSKVGEVPTS